MTATTPAPPAVVKRTASPRTTVKAPMFSRMSKRRLANVMTVIALVIGAAFILLPIFWLVDTAFKPAQYAFVVPPHFVYTPTLQNFRSLVSGQDDQYLSDVGHSLIIMAVSVAIALVLGTPAGYSLSRSRFKGSGTITGWLIVAYIVPALVYIVPLYAIYQKLDISGSYLSVVLYYETFELPFVVFMMRSYFTDVPVVLDEAALVDGATHWQSFRMVILPMVIPGLSTVTILAAITSYGEYFGALIFTGPSNITAPVAIQNYVGLDTSDWSTMAAAALFLVVPVLLVTGVAQRGYLRSSTTASAGGGGG